MDNNTAQVKLEATFDQMKSGLDKAKDFMKGVFNGMKAELKDMSDQAKTDSKAYEGTIEQLGNVVQNKFKGMNSAIEGMKTVWVQAAAVVGAGMAMKAAVNEAVEYNTNAQKLARTLGITANAASVLSMAIGDVYGSTDQYLAAIKGLDRQLRTNEDGLKAMGLATRDSSGEFRNQQDIMLDALEVLRGYKEGTDRNLAAQALFGKGIDVSNEMLALNADRIAAAQEKAESLNLVVGDQSVEATNDYRAAMNDFEDTMDGIKVTIGNALMPVLTDLANWFSDIGPTAILAIRVAIATLTALLRGLALAVRVVWEIFSAAFKNMTIVAEGFGEVFSKAMSGDFAGARAAAQNMFNNMVSNAKDAFDTIVDAAYDAGSKTTDAFSDIITGKQQGTAAAGNEGGDKGYVDADAEEKKAKAAAAARAKETAEAKRAAQEQHRIEVEKYQARMEVLKGDEQNERGHWDAILAIQREELELTKQLYGEGSREYQAIANKIAATERAKQTELTKIKLIGENARREMELSALDEADAIAAHEVEMGRMKQEQLTQLLLVHEEQRYQIRLAALQAEALAAADEPIRKAQLDAQIEAMEQAHWQRMGEIRRAAEANDPTTGMFNNMQSGWANAINGMLNKTMTLKQGLNAIWKTAYSEFVNEMITKPLSQWMMRMARELVMHKLNLVQKNVLEKVSAASNIAKSAAMAGAAGTASFAAAPWPINMGAPAFGAAMAAAASGFMAGASAEGGFDIPAGVNPITQLHQKEMVLPAAQADVIRDLAEAGTAFGGGDQYHISALDARSFDDFLRRNANVLAKGLARIARDGNR